MKSEPAGRDVCRVATSVSEWTDREFEGKVPLAHARSYGVELNSDDLPLAHARSYNAAARRLSVGRAFQASHHSSGRISEQRSYPADLDGVAKNSGYGNSDVQLIR